MTKSSIILCHALFFIISGCKQKAPETLFTEVATDDSEVTFINQNIESQKDNIFEFEYYYNGGGVAIGDINNDGLADIYFSGNANPNQLFLNEGNLSFKNITAISNTACVAGWKTGVTMVDINGDGFLDIYVCRTKDRDPEKRRNSLLINNGNLTFTDRAREYGLDSDSYSTQAAFFDFDKDGDLDAFLLNHSLLQISNSYKISQEKKNHNEKYAYTTNKLLRSEQGKFIDVSELYGIPQLPTNFGLGVGISDFNQDGWPDLYTSCDYTGSGKLLINDHGTRFYDATDSLLSHISLFSMGLDIADINDDGLTDLLTLDMLPPDNERQKQLFVPDRYEPFMSMVNSDLHYQYMRNMLHINNGDGTFSEIGQLAGISATDWSWSPLIADFDNDGLSDIFVSNSFKRDFTNNDFLKYRASQQLQNKNNPKFYSQLLSKLPSHQFQNYVFQNTGKFNFIEQSKTWGLSGFNSTNGAAYADLDNDGDLDLITNNLNAPSKIYRNNQNLSSTNHYLKIKLQGRGMNTEAIGSKVIIYFGNEQKIREVYPVRGFQSSVDAVLHFGIGKINLIDSIHIQWPSGRWQKEGAKEVDQVIVINESTNQFVPADENLPKLFAKINSPISYRHSENDFIDFKIQSLLPRAYSTTGPALAIADVNGDGFNDIFIGGAKGQSAELWLQSKPESYRKKLIPDFIEDAESEDVSATFFDADGDKDLDLYVVSGGYEFEKADKNLQDRLYLNVNGSFTRSSKSIPFHPVSGSCAKAADVDADGDQDLFIGSRVLPGRYPQSPGSILLINDGKGFFSDQTSQRADILTSLELVTDAVWLDLNNDKLPELIVVGEWSPIRIFQNDKGHLRPAPTSYSKDGLNGWWNCIAADDLDHDGDKDLIIGNYGMNNPIKPSSDRPAVLYYADFDKNGSIDPILTYYIQGKSYPYADRDELGEQLPVIKKRFPTYNAFAQATISTLLQPGERSETRHLVANNFESIILLNEGNYAFTIKPLPIEAQFAPIFSIAVHDINSDGHPDIVTGGNLSKTRVRSGKLTGNTGFAFLGNGKGDFTFLAPRKSGLTFGHSDVRNLIISENHLIAAINDSELQFYRLTLNKK